MSGSDTPVGRRGSDLIRLPEEPIDVEVLKYHKGLLQTIEKSEFIDYFNVTEYDPYDAWERLCYLVDKTARKVKSGKRKNRTPKRKRDKRKREDEILDKVKDGVIHHANEKDEVLDLHFKTLKRRALELEPSKISKSEKKKEKKVHENAKNLLLRERFEQIKHFLQSIPMKIVYVDSLNLTRSYDKVLHVLSLFPKLIEVCFVVRECDS